MCSQAGKPFLLVDLLVDMVLGCKAAGKMLAEVDWHGQVR